MSEPMSSVEIEDVLASIRRLVSDDLRPHPRKQAEAVPAVQPVADKLVLTPALRIVPVETAGSVAVAPEAAPAQDPVAEAGFIAVDDEDADAPVMEVPAALAGVDAYDDEGAAAPVEMPAATPEAVFSEPEPEPSAAPEPASSAAPAKDWADQAEAAVRAELEQETVSTASARFLDDNPAEPVFDEAAMREMVREIIREELQGTLGERITRNVRKLVRAEIARALSVRDFD